MSLALFVLAAATHLHAACPGCTQFAPGVVLGTATVSGLNEASGIAVSAFNPGVIWTHNDDGSDGKLYALAADGTLLAKFDMKTSLSDVEDMALGPGPVDGVAYLYAGDIGASHHPNEVRNSVKIVRIPEPSVSLSWSNNPPSVNFNNVETFTLLYPDGSFDAETLMLDPVSGDLFVGTKQNNGSRIYRANLNGAANHATLDLHYMLTVPFPSASGGAISANGGRIALRRENAAQMWIRCDGESVSNALMRAGKGIPVIAPPTEANGEAIAFMPDGTGYVTISDSTANPPIYFFEALCSLTAPGTEITQQPQSIDAEPGADVMLTVQATGEALTYQWRFGESDIPGANASTLSLFGVQPANTGAYTVLVSGAGGSEVSSAAFLNVRILPPVITTQPANTLAATGSTVRLSVEVQGSAPFTYLWTRNGRRLPDSGATLTLTNVQHANAGKYRVVVANSAGHATSVNATLKVLKPPVIVLEPLPKSVIAGAKATFRTRAKGSPHLRYQWLFNGIPFPAATKSSLTLKGVQAPQSGQYSVTVSNAVGVATSPAVELLVQ